MKVQTCICVLALTAIFTELLGSWVAAQETGTPGPVLGPGEVEYSGPIRVELAAESAPIQQAPAYDQEEARKYLEILPEIRALVDSIGEAKELTAFGPAHAPQEQMQGLQERIEELTQDEHQLSFVMVDLQTRSGVAYQPDTIMCTQSTIKGIYVGSVLDWYPQALEENGQYMRDAIEFSDNESYHRLREIYGTEPIERWCEEAGVDLGFAWSLYPRDHSAKDMFKMWTRLYAFLNSGAPAADFGRYFADSSCSATRKELGAVAPLQSKAGWENGLDEDLNYDPNAVIPYIYIDKDPSNDECAINDTGVVYTDKGPYLFVIYSDHPYGVFRDYTPPNPLSGLVQALFALQQSLS